MVWFVRQADLEETMDFLASEASTFFFPVGMQIFDVQPDMKCPTDRSLFLPLVVARRFG